MPTLAQQHPGYHTHSCVTRYIATFDPECQCNNYTVDTLLYVAALSAIMAGEYTHTQKCAMEEYGLYYENLYTHWGDNVAPWSLATEEQRMA